MTLGEKLAELRQKSGLSQDRVAELLGVSRQAVSKWERDEAKPDLDNIVNLSNIYNVTTDYLLKEKPEEKREDRYQNTATYRRSTVFEDIMHFIKEKWYWAGYGVAAWGIIDIIIAATGNIIWSSMTGSFIGTVEIETGATNGVSEVIVNKNIADPFFDTMMNVPSYVLWLPVLIGLVKIVVGVIIAMYGKRYTQRMKAKGYR